MSEIRVQGILQGLVKEYAAGEKGLYQTDVSKTLTGSTAAQAMSLMPFQQAFMAQTDLVNH